MIYVFAKNDHDKGGVESLHQLAIAINKLGYEVKMYYFNSKSLQIPERFSTYGLLATKEIVDSDKNYIIVPEMYTSYIYEYQKINICIWWLSVDFYLRSIPIERLKWKLKEKSLPLVLLPPLLLPFYIREKNRGLLKKYYRFEDHDKYFHLYNCEYARLFLTQHNVKEERMLYLCGPIDSVFFDGGQLPSDKQRERIVVYNPAKGPHFSEKIIAKAERDKNIAFVPIMGMSSLEVANLLLRASVYMDFGDFPGPERIPREAVTMRCNILTSQNGAASNKIDVPIPEDLKFETKKRNIPIIVAKIEDMLDNYEKYTYMYDIYRQKVLEQKSIFVENTKIFLKRFCETDIQ